MSVVIPTYRRPQTLRKALASILAGSYPNLEIIVVDDAHDDATHRAALECNDERVRYVAHTQRKLTAASVNDGIRVAGGEILVLSADDQTVARDAVERFVRRIQRDPHLGWVGAVVYYQDWPDGVQSSGTYRSRWARRLITLGENQTDPQRGRPPYEVPIVDSCVAVSRRVIEATGLIRETRFPFYHELASVQYLALAQGYRIVVDPEIKAWHDRPPEDRGIRALVSPLRSYYTVRSRIFFERDCDDGLHRATFALSLPLYVGHFLLHALSHSGTDFPTKRAVAGALLRGVADGLLDRSGIVIL